MAIANHGAGRRTRGSRPGLPATVLALALCCGTAGAEDDAGLGDQAYRQGRYAEAASHLEKALAQERDERAGRLFVELGDCRLHLKHWEAAVEAYRRGLDLKAGSAEVHRAVAHALTALARYDEAIGSLAQAAALEPAGEDELTIARLFVRLEDWRPAELAATRHLAAHADSTEGRELLAYALARAGRPAEAAEVYRMLARRHPLEVRYRVALGQAEVAAGRYGDAIDDLEAAERLRSAGVERGGTGPGGPGSSADGARLLGDLYLREQMPREAAAAYARMLALTPGGEGIGAEDWYRLGNARLEAGETLSAREAFERALAASPRHARAALVLAQVASRAGEAEGARRHFAQAMEAGAADPGACVALAQFEAAGGRWAAAAAAWDEAVRRGDRTVVVLHARAEAWGKAGSADKAWEALKEGLREHPVDERLRTLLRQLAK
ncbi:MAG: tetratricopeptide repeat protein [Planctomycetes bacterium]|nr:tetratricopeptide repeat protein [Planctomycetota bacterium]